MPKEDHWKQFQLLSDMYRASRTRKFRQGHFKLVYSKLIELTAKALGIGIKKRAKLFWGRELTVVYPEPTSLATSRYGFYEEGLTTMVKNYLGPGMTFLDIGAHIGYFTLLASWIVGDRGQVHSFEPTPSTFQVLRSNTGTTSNIYLNQFAVGSKSGTVTLNDYGPAFSGYNSVYPARMPESQLSHITPTKFQASSVSIDEYVAKTTIVPNFVKIDAESSEFDVLQGMSTILSEYRPMISVEVGDMGIEGVILCKDIVTYICEKGYRAYEFRENHIVPHTTKEVYVYDNILFLPDS